VRGWLSRPEPYGLLLRLLLMPLGAFWDLYAYYWLGHQWVYHGAVPASWYGGYMRFWPPFYLHAGWLWLIKPFFGSGDPWGEALRPGIALTQPWMTVEALQGFCAQPHLHGLLVLLKAPYALAELLMIWMLLRSPLWFGAVRRRMAWVLWLNPVTLYLVYLCGTWDIIVVSALVASVVLLRRHLSWSGLVFAVAGIMKVFPLLLFPFVVLSLKAGGRRRQTFASSVLVTVGLWFVAGTWSGVNMSAIAFGMPHYDMVTTSLLSLRYLHDRLYLFIIGYVLLVCHAVQQEEASVSGLMRYSAAALLLFYSLCFFHPQYVLWGVPFLAGLIARRTGFLWLCAIQVVCLGIYTLQWGPIFTTYLLAPLNPALIAQPPPLERMAQYVEPGLVTGVAHSVFAAVSLWMAYEILRGHSRPRAL